MTFVVTLLRTMVKLDAEVLGMSEACLPYVVIHARRQEIGSNALSREVIARILFDVLPPDVRIAFDDIGAIKCDLPVPAEIEEDDEHFSIVAVAGRRLQVEIRRPMHDDGLQVPPAESFWPAADR